MPPKVTAEIQQDADRLCWSREPDIRSTTRIRRWVRRLTAIGPKSKGGLNNMSWHSHTQAFYAEWVVRYLHPADSQWKRVLDQLLLRNKRTGKSTHGEGRQTLICRLTSSQKTALMKNLPTKATYIKNAIRAFWRLGIEQCTTNDDGSTNNDNIAHRRRINMEQP